MRSALFVVACVSLLACSSSSSPRASSPPTTTAASADTDGWRYEPPIRDDWHGEYRGHFYAPPIQPGVMGVAHWQDCTVTIARAHTTSVGTTNATRIAVIVCHASGGDSDPQWILAAVPPDGDFNGSPLNLVMHDDTNAVVGVRPRIERGTAAARIVRTPNGLTLECSQLLGPMKLTRVR
jgi:hypothetical protein